MPFHKKAFRISTPKRLNLMKNIYTFNFFMYRHPGVYSSKVCTFWFWVFDVSFNGGFV